MGIRVAHCIACATCVYLCNSDDVPTHTMKRPLQCDLDPHSMGNFGVIRRLAICSRDALLTRSEGFRLGIPVSFKFRPFMLYRRHFLLYSNCICSPCFLFSPIHLISKYTGRLLVSLHRKARENSGWSFNLRADDSM